jgi:hypothetical protein
MNRAVALLVLLSFSCAGCAQGKRADGAPARDAQSTWPEGDKDTVRHQVEDHMRIDPRIAGLEEFVVEIAVVMNPDGSVQSARIDSSGDNGHPNWRVFAEQCLRAVLKSSPLRMPPDQPYQAWKTMTLVFHGREMSQL